MPPPNPLDHLSSGEWQLRPAFRHSDPDKLAEERAVDEYLMEQYKAIYRFAEPWPADIKQKVHDLYRNEVKTLEGGMGCMQAAYQCLETIHSGRPKYKDDGRESLREKVYDVSVNEKKFNSVDLMMETLQKDKLAGEPLVVTFDKKAKQWSPPPEAQVLSMFDSSRQGVYFFGVSVAKGEHTALVMVDNTPQADGRPSPRLYWLDQHTGGLDAKSDVTGTLGTKLGEVWKDPARPNRIWPLRPEQMTRAQP